MKKEIISSNNAPAAIGAYSQAIKMDNLIFTSGQLPINPEINEMPETIKEQTKQSLENISAILKEANTSLDQAIKLTVFLADINDFAEMNEAYSEFFKNAPPARSAFSVLGIPKVAKIEIECIAHIE